MINITPTQLSKAADIQERIISLQEELGQLLGGEAPTPAQSTEAPKKYKFSAAARAKMRAAQKARWVKIKGAKAGNAVQKPRKKRKMSAARRRALERAWEARRANGKAAAKSK